MEPNIKHCAHVKRATDGSPSTTSLRQSREHRRNTHNFTPLSIPYARAGGFYDATAHIRWMSSNFLHSGSWEYHRDEISFDNIDLFSFYDYHKKWISSNKAIILELQASLGKLRRNDALSCIIWKSVISEKTCCFILPDNLGGKHDDNRSMNKGSVDYENDKHLSVLRFSTKILKILHLELKLLNNMALITLSSSGATTWSSCYGCVFDWVGWVVESNGTIVEIEADSPEKQRNDFLISVKVYSFYSLTVNWDFFKNQTLSGRKEGADDIKYVATQHDT
ncbi:hypothetical protein RhiirA1_465266 [Rhizophagus irregularis]|uniref:Uncharacterized protein n=2 Tax=Rhizophagus irregularis TaxID=588596 RepID=A0A2N0RD68_9GLOM|nr:hypothetical protein RhiirA1_466841 [Rhizophagus irregularis]PKC62355.1 hypothetical protein RhiirA1_465266 [Rhizophagus irregularis]